MSQGHESFAAPARTHARECTMEGPFTKLVGAVDELVVGPLRVVRPARPEGPSAADVAERLYMWEALGPAEGRAPQGPPPEPYTLEWFLRIENQRLGRHGRWIPALLEFAKHSGETLLGLGTGLGTDWLQYARHGASVVVCSPSSEQLALIRRNFELRGLGGRFLHARTDCLPLESATIDVACVSGLLDEARQPAALAVELYRVLKPGGKVIVVASARYDAAYWSQALLPWRRFAAPQPPADGRTSFSARGLRQLFDRFVEHRVRKRHLSRRDVPHMWRWLPRPLLERALGRVLVLKAFKPLSAAKAGPMAA